MKLNLQILDFLRIQLRVWGQFHNRYVRKKGDLNNRWSTTTNLQHVSLTLPMFLLPCSMTCEFYLWWNWTHRNSKFSEGDKFWVNSVIEDKKRRTSSVDLGTTICNVLFILRAIFDLSNKIAAPCFPAWSVPISVESLLRHRCIQNDNDYVFLFCSKWNFKNRSMTARAHILKVDFL